MGILRIWRLVFWRGRVGRAQCNLLLREAFERITVRFFS